MNISTRSIFLVLFLCIGFPGTYADNAIKKLCNTPAQLTTLAVLIGSCLTLAAHEQQTSPHLQILSAPQQCLEIFRRRISNAIAQPLNTWEHQKVFTTLFWSLIAAEITQNMSYQYILSAERNELFTENETHKTELVRTKKNLKDLQEKTTIYEQEIEQLREKNTASEIANKNADNLQKNVTTLTTEKNRLQQQLEQQKKTFENERALHAEIDEKFPHAEQQLNELSRLIDEKLTDAYPYMIIEETQKAEIRQRIMNQLLDAMRTNKIRMGWISGMFLDINFTLTLPSQ